MKHESDTAEVNINLRAREADRDLIDMAAEIAGTNRSQFMLRSAINEAKNLVLDQTEIKLDAKAFKEVLVWMDKGPSPEQAQKIEKLMSRKPNWVQPKSSSKPK